MELWSLFPRASELDAHREEFDSFDPCQIAMDSLEDMAYLAKEDGATYGGFTERPDGLFGVIHTFGSMKEIILHFHNYLCVKSCSHELANANVKVSRGCLVCTAYLHGGKQYLIRIMRYTLPLYSDTVRNFEIEYINGEHPSDRRRRYICDEIGYEAAEYLYDRRAQR